MAKQDDEIIISRADLDRRIAEAVNAATGPIVKATVEAMSAQQTSAIRDQTIQLLTSKSLDEKMVEDMARYRGADRPPLPEYVIPCKSPVTGATFGVRILKSKAYPEGRIVELIDYVRPTGWDKHVDEGGLYDGVRDTLYDKKTGVFAPSIAFRKYAFERYLRVDSSQLQGQPARAVDQYRVDSLPAFIPMADPPARADAAE